MTPDREDRRLHAGCMVCGDLERNPDTLGLVFVEIEGGGVAARFRPTPRHQGYDGLLHGGMIATLLDAAMTHCLFARGVSALTAELTVRFITPVETTGDVVLSARLVGHRRNFYRLESTLIGGGHLLARATAKFLETGVTDTGRSMPQDGEPHGSSTGLRSG
jgi:uncharacterized protein (TIGR00369 family)